MRKETDLAKIKAVAHTFLVMDIQPTAHAPVVVSHPFTNSGFVGVRDVEGNLAIADLLNKPEDCCLWREQIGQYIDQADSAYQVFLLLNKPYMLTFLKYTAPSLSERDLGQILANAWMKQWEIRTLYHRYPDLLRRALAIEDAAKPNLTSVRGLGRNWAWRDFIRADENQIVIPGAFSNENLPCSCCMGGETPVADL